MRRQRSVSPVQPLSPSLVPAAPLAFSALVVVGLWAQAARAVGAGGAGRRGGGRGAQRGARRGLGASERASGVAGAPGQRAGRALYLLPAARALVLREADSTSIPGWSAPDSSAREGCLFRMKIPHLPWWSFLVLTAAPAPRPEDCAFQ